MNTKKFLISELFNIVSGVPINEKEAYQNIGNIPVISSKTRDNGVIFKVNKNFLLEKGKVFNRSGISWAIDGNAGKLFIQVGEYFLSNHAGVLLPKKKYIALINLKWFCFFFQKKIMNSVIAKSGQGKLGIEQMANIEVDIPIDSEGEIDINIQNEIYSKNEQRLSSISIAQQGLNKINQQLAKHVQYKSEKFKISELFHITSGVRITQTDIYNNTGDFPVVTSKTKNEGIAWFGDKNWLMTIEKNSKKVIVAQECLTWTKDGAKCGTMFYRDYEFYPNDHCGVLVPRKPLNLKWLKLVMQPIVFSSVVAKDAQGMLYEEQMANIGVDIPIDSEGEIDIDTQNKIYEEYKVLTHLRTNLENLISKYKI